MRWPANTVEEFIEPFRHCQFTMFPYITRHTRKILTAKARKDDSVSRFR